MSNQIISFLAANYLVLGSAILANIAFFLLGSRYATASQKSTNEELVLAAYQDGFKAAEKMKQEEKQAFSQDVTSELSKLRDGIINSARAYRDTLEIIEKRVGFSSEDTERLLIGRAVAAEPTLSLLDVPAQNDSDFSEVSAGPIAKLDVSGL